MKIPVIKGRIGNWKYYSGVMTFKDISTSVTASIGELYKAPCLSEELQRGLTSNYESIRDYILKDDERFFNAIILAIYDGDPKWLEVEFKDAEKDFCNVGFLEFSGKEIIFPVDGQHRVAGIIEALKNRPELCDEEVPVVFIAHKNTDDGKKKTRKLFSTLNRRAKPVGQNENIALDEDDVCSIITRDLIQEFELFSNENVVNSLGKQIPNGNEVAITSLITLYQCVDIIIKNKLAKEKITGKKYREYLLYRPDEQKLESLREYVFEMFTSFLNQIECIKEYNNSDKIDKAKPYRNSNGGNLLFRPIAITEFFAASLLLMERKSITFNDAFKILNSIEFDISKTPWKGLIWDGSKIINRVSKQVIKLLIVSMADQDCLSELEKYKLIDGYASALNTTYEEAKEFLNLVSER